MRVLLIGGTGFVGSHVAHALIDAGHHVSVLSRGLHDPIEGADALAADRHDRAALSSLLEGRRFDCTVDLAAYGAADVEQLLTVPYAALGRYVLISTGQVYLVTDGKQPPYREEDSDGVLTAEPPAGTNDHDEWAYGVGKRRAEGALLALRASHGMRAVILRLPIVIGEGDTSRRLWAWIERLLDGDAVLLPEGGRQSTRFIHVSDVARAVMALLDQDRAREAVYNLSGPDVATLRDVLTRVADLAGVKPTFVEASTAELEQAGIEPSDLPYSGRWVSVLDPSRAAAEWGLMGARLAETLPPTVRWHLEHRPPSHPGYARRVREVELAARVTQTAGDQGAV